MPVSIFKSVALSVAIAAATLAAPTSASADTEDVIAGAIVGIAGLVILDSIVNDRHHNRAYAAPRYRHSYEPPVTVYEETTYYEEPEYVEEYYAPPPRRREYRHERRVSYGAPRPWSKAWYRYCANKYRSFDPGDGTFQPYEGGRRLCR